MVSVAIRSRFASHRQSPPAPIAASGHTGVRPVALVAAMVPSDSKPPLSHLAAALLPLGGLLLAETAALSHHGVVGNGNSAPRLDASAASSTSAISPLHCAPLPRPTARTGAEFLHSLVRPQSAVGFESRQTARLHPFLEPFFGATSAPVSSRITLKKALAHIAKVM